MTSDLRCALHAANLLRWEAIQTGCPIKTADADRAYLELTRDARVSVTRENVERRGIKLPGEFK